MTKGWGYTPVQGIVWVGRRRGNEDQSISVMVHQSNIAQCALADFLSLGIVDIWVQRRRDDVLL